eukprot:755442-Hanusia_phi.AAC.9
MGNLSGEWRGREGGKTCSEEGTTSGSGQSDFSLCMPWSVGGRTQRNSQACRAAGLTDHGERYLVLMLTVSILVYTNGCQEIVAANFPGAILADPHGGTYGSFPLRLDDVCDQVASHTLLGDYDTSTKLL